VDNIKLTHPSFTPGLAIVQVGDRKDSNVYIRMKIKAAAEVISCILEMFPLCNFRI